MMKGITDNGKSSDSARPMQTTLPRGRVVLTTAARVSPPRLSTAPAPDRLAQRSRLRLDGGDDLVGTEASEVVGPLAFVRRRNAAVTPLRQQVNRKAADAAGCPGHQHRAVFRTLAVPLHQLNRVGGGKTGGAYRHHLKRVETFGQGHHQLRGQARVGRITAVVDFTQAAALGKNGVALGKTPARIEQHLAREIYAADQRAFRRIFAPSVPAIASL